MLHIPDYEIVFAFRTINRLVEAWADLEYATAACDADAHAIGHDRQTRHLLITILLTALANQKMAIGDLCLAKGRNNIVGLHWTMPNVMDA